MNDQIRNLILTAQQQAAKETIANSFAYEHLVYAKFAELIVRKCLELAHDEHKMALEYEWDNDDTATSIRESISKHFGVEE
jgi:hypothetical protein